MFFCFGYHLTSSNVAKQRKCSSLATRNALIELGLKPCQQQPDNCSDTTKLGRINTVAVDVSIEP
jgi:hypothetical protein